MDENEELNIFLTERRQLVRLGNKPRLEIYVKDRFRFYRKKGNVLSTNYE